MDDHSRLFPYYFGSPNPKKPSCRPENELLELLWQNGTVIKQTQGIRKPPNELILQPESNESGPSNQSDPIHEDPSWFLYPFEESLEKDLYQEYFSEISPNFNTALAGANNYSAVENNAGHSTNVMDYTNFSHFSRPIGKAKETQHNNNNNNNNNNNKVRSEFGESSKLSSSYCTSNQEQPWVSEMETMRVSSERMYTSTNDMTATSTSSGGSGGNFGKTGDQIMNYGQQITKAKEGENSESHSEDADDNEAMKPGKSINKRTSKRRSRAAEVHNLSERRRRDRINEKMRALQELIPHCNKTDKASILDEAIEYLKSLQMQVQLMWMGGGAPPMMYPGINPLMACIRPVTVNPSNVPHHMQGLVHVPRMPFINPSLAATLNHPMSNHLPQFVGAPAMNPASNNINIHAQMQGFHIAQHRGPQAAQVANANASRTNVAQSIQLSGPTGSMILPNSGEFSMDAEKK